MFAFLTSFFYPPAFICDLPLNNTSILPQKILDLNPIYATD
jgi:hypothetical protein